MGVLQYQVRTATQRLLQWQCIQKKGWVPGVGIVPRLWRDAEGTVQPQTGLASLEAGQKGRWDNVEASGSGGSGTGQRFSDAALSQAYDAAWMHPSADRQHPLQRAANAAAVLTVQRQQQMVGQAAGAPAQNDLADPLTGLTEPPKVTAPWAASFRRLWNKRLPRSLRVFGWRLLHNSLWVGARKQYFRPRQECVCRQAPCLLQNPAPLQTLSHVLLECPVAQEVWDWFLSVWCRIDPTSIAVASQQLLLDEVSAEVVAVDLQPLWTHLRLLLNIGVFVGLQGRLSPQ